MRRDKDVEEREGSLGSAGEATDPSGGRVIVGAVLKGTPTSVFERAADAGRYYCEREDVLESGTL
jgi:hypothetical protein